MPLTYGKVAGNTILAADHNEVGLLLKGQSGSGEGITLVYNAAGVIVLQPSSDPAANTQAIQIKNNAGTVQSALTFDGKGIFGGTLSLTTTGSSIQISGAATMPATGDVRFGIGGAGVSMTARNAANAADVVLLDWSVAVSNQVRFNGAAVAVNAANVALPTLVLAGTLTAGGTLNYGAQIGTSGPVVYSGSGVPTISAAVIGSLYLRTDGSSASTRMYVATTTAGGWTAVTTAA